MPIPNYHTSLCSHMIDHMFRYLLILWAHVGNQHGHVVCVPHPRVTGEVLQDHHGFVQPSDGLHHSEIKQGDGRGKHEKVTAEISFLEIARILALLKRYTANPELSKISKDD